MGQSMKDSGRRGPAAPVAELRTVVVLDTDPGVRWALTTGLRAAGYAVHAVASVGEALDAMRGGAVDGLVLELLPEAGLDRDAIRLFTESENPPRVVCVSVDAAPQTVIECMRLGAADFLPKPFSLTDIRSSLRRVFSSDADRRALRKPPRPGEPVQRADSFLIGISPAIQELREVITQVAQTDLNCLIRGQSGTGKDMVAREIHRLSRRHEKAFIKVNCTALPEQLLESELFGYEKGAFTGAVSAKPGRFELANNGIIFLDEIGDMHPNLQAKLLQVIEHKEFTKLGGRKHIEVDVQIIAATNANLEERTRQGLFRDDLYFRLNEVSIWVPGLSERREDIPLLVRHFIQKHGIGDQEAAADITGEDLARLSEYDWPGNVRELESAVKRWLALGGSALILNDANRAPATAPADAEVEAGDDPAPSPAAAEPESEEVERARILAALEQNQWNRRRAAEDLGMSYQTLRRRIEKYRLNHSR
jgi:DNA-binding NtrC family response regulator